MIVRRELTTNLKANLHVTHVKQAHISPTEERFRVSCANQATQVLLEVRFVWLAKRESTIHTVEGSVWIVLEDEPHIQVTLRVLLIVLLAVQLDSPPGFPLLHQVDNHQVDQPLNLHQNQRDSSALRASINSPMVVVKNVLLADFDLPKVPKMSTSVKLVRSGDTRSNLMLLIVVFANFVVQVRTIPKSLKDLARRVLAARSVGTLMKSALLVMLRA